MRNRINYMVFLSLLLPLVCFGQELKKPSEGKSLVYFVWVYIDIDSTYPCIIESPDVYPEDEFFSVHFFDGNVFLDKKKWGEYMYYECEPGEHLFWYYSHQICLLEADLLPNKTYIAIILSPYSSKPFLPLSYPSAEEMDYISQIFPKGYEILPVNKSLDSCRFSGLKEYLIPLLIEKEFVAMKEVFPTKKRKIRKLDEMKRKSAILYKHRLRIKEPIPYLDPEMYIELPESDILK
ncbi:MULTISPECIES: hypothetical protein [unclassified Lentimicrobium]|uniref:hypothetical protein n=1 Tax=unclassified Lentimicrobium TaxID=2677434 RepID=UPI00155239D9|nr:MULTISPECIES: hypothetical protein [unclassified Lentimicrobium]NPD45398.1 hypothetical protein [Lentimicrobium sp. S6]NPD86870.1 hypothetical protein [Lentimicrobium sp. L6]